jgi:glucose-6-phosphate-specific signal transduction histidine kinase
MHIHVIPRWGGKLLWHGREEIKEEVAREVVEKLRKRITGIFLLTAIIKWARYADESLLRQRGRLLSYTPAV